MNDLAKIKQIHQEKLRNMNTESAPVSANKDEGQNSQQSQQVVESQPVALPTVFATGVEGVPQDVLESLFNKQLSEIQKNHETEIAKLKKEIESLKTSYENQIDNLTKQKDSQIAQERQARENAVNVLRAMGTVRESSSGLTLNPGTPFYSGEAPAVHFNHGTASSRQAYREMATVLQETPKAYSISPQGEQILTKDYRSAQRFLAQNYENVMGGLAAEMKKFGFLQGNISGLQKEAPTSPGSLPYAFLETLSLAVERRSHSPRFVFHNLVNSTLRIGENVGNILKIPRDEWLEEGLTEQDYLLDPMLSIASATDPIRGGSIPVEIQEYGRGKNIRPVAIPEFYAATAIDDLVEKLSQKLGRSYEYFKDLIIRQHLYATTRVVYNDNNSVTATPGNVNAGDKGTMTFNFLSQLHAYMASLQIPAWEQNGCYAIVMNPTAFAQLEVDLYQNGRFFDKTGIERITNMFRRLTMGTQEVIYGYEGMVANFMIFRSNATGVGIPGTEGVNSDALGVGATTVRSSLATGSGSVINAVVRPFLVKVDPSTDYGRLVKAIWHSYEGYAPADVDPLSNPPISNNQQLRVVEVRTTEVEV